MPACDVEINTLRGPNCGEAIGLAGDSAIGDNTGTIVDALRRFPVVLVATIATRSGLWANRVLNAFCKLGSVSSSLQK
jgi:hypothetical protein